MLLCAIIIITTQVLCAPPGPHMVQLPLQRSVLLGRPRLHPGLCGMGGQRALCAVLTARGRGRQPGAGRVCGGSGGTRGRCVFEGDYVFALFLNAAASKTSGDVAVQACIVRKRSGGCCQTGLAGTCGGTVLLVMQPLRGLL